MINWRKPTILLLLRLSGSKVPQKLREIKTLENYPFDKKVKIQKEKLKNLLLYSYKNVPYYRKILSEAGVMKNGEVFLENFSKIPILTKEIIRREGANLYSKEHIQRHSYQNTSGGSTGEPVTFLQDKEYDYGNIATKIYFFSKHGKDLGEKEVKLWGSDVDIIKGNLTIKDRIINYLYNRRFFNCYDFSEEAMNELVKLNNHFKPASYWTYVDAVYEFSKYILTNKIRLYSPKLIITTIGPLYEKNRAIIEKAFGSKVFNQYGSREVGGISLENENGEMEVCIWRQILELEGSTSEKEIVITCLDNYSMPLIRYSIGDVAEEGNKSYKIGDTVSYLTTKPVIGRTLGFFKKKDGTLKHSHFLVQQLFFRNWIKKFQAVQNEYDKIEISIVGEENEAEMKDIEEKTKMLMGKEFKVKWHFVKDIPKTRSGKHLYTICNIK